MKYQLCMGIDYNVKNKTLFLLISYINYRFSAVSVNEWAQNMVCLPRFISHFQTRDTYIYCFYTSVMDSCHSDASFMLMFRMESFRFDNTLIELILFRTRCRRYLVPGAEEEAISEERGELKTSGYGGRVPSVFSQAASLMISKIN